MAKTVVGPDGLEWKVRRRWVPRPGTETLWGRFHRRFRAAFRRMSDLDPGVDPGCSVDVGEGFLVVIVVVVVVLLAIYIGFPLIIALVEVVGLIVLLIGGVVARVVFRRPWLVDAHGPDGLHLTWPVVGWRASGRRRDEIVAELEAGAIPQGGSSST
ncbi:MAG TPA: hypothetical protein VJM33_06165 [Microthrixaceae bacterium]|nr:hypothetical protein [Microthrixaceae bacterium]